MKKILCVLSSPSGEYSVSNKLAKAIVEKLSSSSDSEVTEFDLTKEGIPHIDGATIAAFYTPVEYLDDDKKATLATSDRVIDALLAADEIVISVPFHNFGIPSSLKAWIDHVARVGKTFYFNADGTPTGMVTGKKVYLAISSGGIYSSGPMQSFDFAEPYLRAILGFLGITDVTTFRAEGMAIPGVKEIALPNAIEQLSQISA